MEGKERVMREKRLYEASLKGDVQSLMELMQEDELTLDHRVPVTCFNESPLHIAAMKGHLDFAKALLQHKPDMVTELDSRGRSPLHLASANGHVEMVKFLVTIDPSICHTEDEDGWTPLHLAAKKGRVKVVKELVKARPEVMMYPLNRVNAISIIHSYVIHNGWEALGPLVEADHNVLNSQDGDGNTILHKATALKQVEVLKYVLSASTEVKVNIANAKGFTALDVIEQMPKDFKTRQVHELLVNAGAKRGGELSAMEHDTNQLVPIEFDEISMPVSVTVPTQLSSLPQTKSQDKIKKLKRLVKRKQDMLLLAATVIATMAYQAGLNPPGGVWQQETEVKTSNGHNVTVDAGTSVLATLDPKSYRFFWIFNSVSFIASVSVIILVMSGLPLLKTRIFMWLLMGVVWLTTLSMAVTYLVTLPALTPWDKEFSWSWDFTERIEWGSLGALLGLSGLVLLVHTCRFIMRIRKVRKDKVVSRGGVGGEGQV